MLDVQLHSSGRTSPPILALVDSGADASAFNIDIADDLGLDLNQCRQTEVRGVGGAGVAYACDVELEIVGRRFPASVRFMPLLVSLLGRHDVFAQFRFAFDQRAETLHVEPYEY
jgi:hypothetical protein